MKIKVCGMKDVENIAALGACNPDLTGLIFYEGSKRYAGQTLTAKDLAIHGKGQQFVGVFVNASKSEVHRRVEEFGLEAVQLHGDESTAYCRQLRDEGLIVIKAIPVSERSDLRKCEKYSGVVDYFLFDTRTEKRGGSGVKFNWELLEGYTEDVPFFLSGGIGPQDVEAVRGLRHEALYGVDVNSGFEVDPGMKDVELVERFIDGIRGV